MISSIGTACTPRATVPKEAKLSVEIRVSETEDVSVESAFAYIDDYTNHPKFLHGSLPLQPITEITRGKGAAFKGGMGLGPVTVKSTVRVIDWEENKLISIDSIEGFDVDFLYEFTAIEPNKTKVDLFVSYRLPGGLAGRVMGKTIEPFVKIAVKFSTHSLKKQIIEFHKTRTNA
jgi:uncharacterized membrane protein